MGRSPAPSAKAFHRRTAFRPDPSIRARHPKGSTAVARLRDTGASMPMKSRLFRVAVVGVLLAVGLSPRGWTADAPVVVASKIDTEGALLGQLIAAVIEAQGLSVTRKIQLG